MTRNAEKSHKQKIKLPFSAVLFYLFLIATVLSGVTFSKYVTDTTLGDSARVAYMRDISISETGNFTEQNNWIIIPGVNMQKKATVKFEGSEMACYVFLNIKTVGWKLKEDDQHRSFVCRMGDTEALSWSVTGDWTYISGDGSNAVFYCIVRANEPLEADVIANNGEIKVDEKLTKSQLESLPADMKIDIGATAVQYHGYSGKLPDNYTANDRAEAVWEIVKSR